MHQTTLATLSPAELAAAFTTVYQDYLVPFVVDEGWARLHLASNDIVSAASPLWLADDGRVIALAALGRRGARGWVGGFGVASDYRGRGLASRLIAALLDSARVLGLAEMRLEVIAGNTRAIRTYERAGFARVHDLRFLTLEPAGAAGRGDPLSPVDLAEMLAHGARLRPVAPVWQREAGAIARTPNLAGAALGPVDAPDVASALALAAALPRHLPGRTLRLANEPEGDPVCAALDRLGWRETLRQYEMACAM